MAGKGLFKTVGRVNSMIERMDLNSDESAKLNTNVQDSMVIHLSSGRVVTFFRDQVAAENVQTKTHVHQHNPRPNVDITPLSLQKIVASIAQMQFANVLATKDKNGYAIFDGQRRREAAIIAGANLNVSYTNEVLSKSEILEIIQYVKTDAQQSLRDAGLLFDKLILESEIAAKNDGTGQTKPLSFRMLARQFDVSYSYVQRALKSIKIPTEVIALLPSPSAINSTQVDTLFKITNMQMDLSELLTPSVMADINEIIAYVPPHKDSAGIYDINVNRNELIINVLKAASKSEPKNAPKARLAENAERDSWVTMRTHKNKTNVEIVKLNEDEIQQLKDFLINLVSNKH
ncbi:ParB/RepB/Spo0J family partition protein [Shewanella sp. SM101]|uniref:ParB/RepB/Spo0J family partition protein n=1 Tax=Shewanella TaxID=22 RepID=UPI0021DB164D|nr:MULTISPECIES: ParB/RepB/Spo0J family partition protein [unclassified Shewanella]MCU8008937.1 ParB/RepB/Spo0J family partition protein [Shewanella sp. SM87]MCU8106888.1 ParB/RepB/Spo0J family partition protein [Shewanella sp. SM101]